MSAKSQLSARKSESRKRGFTLIELMVAISIIAILAAVGLVVYGTAQKTGRISKRIQDLGALKTGLELYKTATGSYPVAATPGTFVCIGAATSSLIGLVPSYMPSLPADPLDSGNAASGTNCYEYTSNSATNATEYKIRTKLNVSTSGEMNSVAFGQQPGLIDTARDGTVDCVALGTYTGWAVYSGGATTCAY